MKNNRARKGSTLYIASMDRIRQLPNRGIDCEQYNMTHIVYKKRRSSEVKAEGRKTNKIKPHNGGSFLIHPSWTSIFITVVIVTVVIMYVVINYVVFILCLLESKRFGTLVIGTNLHMIGAFLNGIGWRLRTLFVMIGTCPADTWWSWVILEPSLNFRWWDWKRDEPAFMMSCGIGSFLEPSHEVLDFNWWLLNYYMYILKCCLLF